MNLPPLVPAFAPALRANRNPRRSVRPAVSPGLRRAGSLALLALLLSFPLLSAAEQPPPEPVPATPKPQSAADAPVPAPTTAPAPPPKPKPKPEPKPGPPVLIPDDLPNGKAIVHFWLFDDITITQLMLYQGNLYGFDGDDLIEYPLDDVRGFEANGKCEILTTTGQLPVPARKALWRDSLFYFQLEDESHMLTPERRIAAIFPPDRFRVYPWIFNKYIAPWGKIYDQRPFFFQFDFGYMQFQSIQRTEWANARLLTGSEIGLWRIKLEGAANYGTVDRITTANNQNGELKFDRYLNGWTYAYLKSGVFHDDINLIDYRLTNGFGFGLGTFQQNEIPLGVFAWGLKSHKLDFEIGTDRIDEKNRDGYQVGWFGRLAVIDKLQISDTVDFDNRFEYQPGLVSRNRENRGQYFLQYRGELRLRLFQGVAIRVAYQFDYNSRPPNLAPLDTHQIWINLSLRYGA